MVEPTTIAAAAGAVKSLEKPISALYSAATGPFKKLAAAWTASGKRDALSQAIQEVELVRTISGTDRVPLSTFYYPSKIIERVPARSAPPRVIQYVEEIATDRNIVIQGTVGQGKSIFMRYLCLQELRQGKKIPIFIELRTLELTSTIRSVLLDALFVAGFGALSDDELNFLLKSGVLVLFLDAFDEIKRELALSVQRELGEFMVTWPTTRVIISTRPGSLSARLGGLPRLKTVLLAPLNDDDFDPFLEALGVTPAGRNKLTSAIAASPTEIKGVLRTPLMLTLLNMTFGTSTHVPNTLHEFYESMFLFLVFRHDETKPGFVRQKATSLSNAELQDAFEHFAFLSKEYGVALTDEEFAVCSKNTTKLCGREFTPEGLRADLTETVCLMQKDGIRTAFIHRSIQEFFAAFFVKHLGAEDQVKRIYERARSSSYMNWQQEIRFLEQIDKYRFIEYFRLPAINQFLAKFGTKVNQNWPTKAKFMAFLNTQPIYHWEVRGPDGNLTSYTVVHIAPPDFDVITFELSKILGCDGFFSDIEDLFGLKPTKIPKFTKHLRSNPEKADAALTKFRDFVKRCDKERVKLERILEERKAHFRDLLLPAP